MIWHGQRVLRELILVANGQWRCKYMDKKFRRRLTRKPNSVDSVISAGVLIFCRTTKRYMLVLRNGHSHDGTWGLVGGKIEENESMIDGLQREIFEEIGMNFSDKKLIPVEKFTSDSGHFTYHTYIAVIDEEFVPIMNSEHRGYCWVNIKDHPKPLHPGVWRILSNNSTVEKIRTIETII
jgi:8-oxo-dGTP pyrophosphatase MutT (NUDIX family)